MLYSADYLLAFKVYSKKNQNIIVALAPSAIVKVSVSVLYLTCMAPSAIVKVRVSVHYQTYKAADGFNLVPDHWHRNQGARGAQAPLGLNLGPPTDLEVS